MFIGRDGRTVNAEHQWQWWRRIYVVYGPPHNRYALFAMLAMFGASAAEGWALLFSCDNFGGFGSVTFTSQAIPLLLIPGFLCFTWVGTGLGTFSSVWAFAESVRNMLNYPLQFCYQLVVLPHRIISKKICTYWGWCLKNTGLARSWIFRRPKVRIGT